MKKPPSDEQLHQRVKQGLSDELHVLNLAITAVAIAQSHESSPLSRCLSSSKP